MKIGVFTDNHSSGLENEIVKGFAKENIDLIINLGDIIEPERGEELVKITNTFLELKKPFISIPGNYESIYEWDFLSKKLKDNTYFIDGEKNTVFNYGEISFISIPGFRTPNLANLKEKTLKYANLNKSIVLSHEPPKQNSKQATDLAIQAENILTGQVVFGRNTKSYIYSGNYKKKFEHRGNLLIRKFIDDLNIHFIFSGHIHEGLNAYSKEGIEIKEDEYTSSLFFNPGPAKNGIYAIITLDENSMSLSYKRHLLFGISGYEELKK